MYMYVLCKKTGLTMKREAANALALKVLKTHQAGAAGGWQTANQKAGKLGKHHPCLMIIDGDHLDCSKQPWTRSWVPKCAKCTNESTDMQWHAYYVSTTSNTLTNHKPSGAHGYWKRVCRIWQNGRHTLVITVGPSLRKCSGQCCPIAELQAVKRLSGSSAVDWQEGRGPSSGLVAWMMLNRFVIILYRFINRITSYQLIWKGAKWGSGLFG